MRSQDTEDIESIASFTDGESEVETKPKPIKKKVRQATPEENLKAGLTKTGRVKREMSEAQKKVLAAARVKAREKRSELKAIRDKEKSLKKDDVLIRRLMVEKKVLEHKNMLKNLAVDAGYASESKRPKPKRKPYTHKDKDDEEPYVKEKNAEIEILKAQLKELQKKHKIQVESDSESDSSDIELEPQARPPIKSTIKPKKVIEPEKDERYKPKKPTIKPVEKVPDIKERRKPQNPMMNYEENDENPAIKAALNSLFA